MKPVLPTIIGVVLAAFATTASAHIAEIITSIPAVKGADDAVRLPRYEEPVPPVKILDG